MNTLLKSIVSENFKSLSRLMHPGSERRVAYEYPHSPRSSFQTTDAVCDTVLRRESARVERRPLAPAKPPMRLEGKRAR